MKYGLFINEEGGMHAVIYDDDGALADDLRHHVPRDLTGVEAANALQWITNATPGDAAEFTNGYLVAIDEVTEL